MTDSERRPTQNDPSTGTPDEAGGGRHEVARISRRLLALETDEIAAAVREEFESAARLARCDRSFFYFMDPSHPEPVWSAAWRANGDVDHPAPRDSGRFPWSLGQLLAGETVHFDAERPLPGSAAAEQLEFAERGVRAGLMMAVRSGEYLVGTHVFERTRESVGWSASEIETLRIVGEMLVCALKRRAIEGALRESEERFRTIAEQATELVAEFDARGRFCYVSPSYAALLGHAPESLIGTRAERLIHPDDDAGSRTKFTRSFEENVPSHSLHRLRHADGRWRWFQNSGRAYRRADGQRRFVSIGHDVTERVEAQRALERQLELERTVARLSRRLLGVADQNLSEEIVGALEETAALSNADRAYLATFPRGPSEHASLHEWVSEKTRPWQPDGGDWAQAKLYRGETIDFHDLDELPPEAAQLREALRRRGTASILAIPLRRGDRSIGVIGFENTTAHRWSEHEIRLLGLIGEILTSAVQRNASVKALRDSQLELMQAQKLEAIGRLAGGIAHDFNNLLTVILGLSRPMMEQLPAGSELAQDLNDIHQAAERAASLTRQLLTFSRRQPVEQRNMDLNATLTQLRPLLERMLGNDVTLVFRLSEEPAQVRGDVHQFEQVIVNLTTNARDAMPEGGTIEIETRIRTVDAATARHLRLGAAGRYVVLSTSDTGEGMDERTRRRIFDPFFTTKDPGKGTGLGLSIVYSVVEQSEGAIEIDSRPGRGSRFQIWLPLQVDDGVVEEDRHPEAIVRDGSECILFVEDEPALRRFGRRILERAGYRVIEAIDGEAALVILQSHRETIDVLVTDVTMPHMSGGELAERVRQVHPDMPILFVSGHASEDENRLDLESSRWLQKPFSADALLERLRDLIDG